MGEMEVVQAEIARLLALCEASEKEVSGPSRSRSQRLEYVTQIADSAPALLRLLAARLACDMAAVSADVTAADYEEAENRVSDALAAAVAAIKEADRG